jgi:hypothetical protein
MEQKGACYYHFSRSHWAQSQTWVLAEQFLNAPVFKLPAKELSHCAPMASELMGWIEQELF